MAMIALTVKGDEYQARAAALAHGLRPVGRAKGLGFSQIVRVEGSPAALMIACEWFCESVDKIPSYGYPAGTLLFYTEARS